MLYTIVYYFSMPLLDTRSPITFLLSTIAIIVFQLFSLDSSSLTLSSNFQLAEFWNFKIAIVIVFQVMEIAPFQM